MPNRPPLRPGLLEEAEEWDTSLRSGGISAREQFVAWIRRSPEHLHAYLQYLALEKEMRGLDPERNIDLSTLLVETSSNVVPLHTDERVGSPRSHGPRMRFYSVATVILVGCGIVGLSVVAALRMKLQPSDYTTAIGEQRRIVLSDGSVVELNTQTHIRVTYRSSSRDVELVSGEAVFSVEHNAVRPFRVQIGRSIVEDVGTQFSIYARPDNTIVSVLDGRVQLFFGQSESQVASPLHVRSYIEGSQPALQLEAGQAARFDAFGRVVNRSAVNVAEAAAWRQHRMWFENATLKEIASEFNRYNTRRIHVVDEVRVAKKRYTATWDPYDLSSFVTYLQNDPTLSVDATADTIVIRGGHDSR
jgi:transmembrane sensor